MVVGEVILYSVIAILGFFTAVLILALSIGAALAISDFCCGTNCMGRKNINDSLYTAPVTVTNVTSVTSVPSGQYDFHSRVDQSDIRTNSNDVELPMCDPMQSYPMPAPEIRRNRTAMPSDVISGNYHVRSNQVPESQPSGNNTDVSRNIITEDLPPSYDEAVRNA